MRYEYRIVNCTDYNTVKEFLEAINLYGAEGFHVIEARGKYAINCVIMQKEEKVIRFPVE